MANTQTFVYKRAIKAPASEVYRAFLSALALREWMSDTAQVEPRKGGRLYLAWNSGYFMHGYYTLLKPNQTVVFTWHGREEPAQTTVRVSLRESNGKTALRLSHSRVGTGKVWRKAVAEFQNGWLVLLENLQSVLETGIDLRVARRPMLGIFFGEPLNAELAAKLGVPVREGLRLAGVLEGLGAHTAGLQKDDVLVSFGGKKIIDVQPLLQTLQTHRAGDKVKVVFYRAAQKHLATMELSPRPIPAMPPSAGELAARVHEIHAADQANIRLPLMNVSAAEADAKPAEGEWSVNEVLAHLICSERDTIAWLGALLNGDVADGVYSSNLTPRVTAVIETYGGIDALLEEWERSQHEVERLLVALPASFVMHKGTYWQAGYSLLNSSTHTRDHINQIESTLSIVRG